MRTNDYDRSAASVRVLRRSIDVEDRAPVGVEQQPLSSVIWVPREQIRPNEVNPNYVPPPELRLLKVSILADGWTQPIVAHELPEDEIVDGILYEVVDGEHRYHVSADPKVRDLTNGLVPVVLLRPVDRDHRVMSTIRHNRARGQHHVLKMADIVSLLVEQGLDPAQLEGLLGMEDEEIERLLDRGNMVKRGSADEFTDGWIPA